MRGFNNVLDFYINSSIHVALAVASLSWVSLIQFNIQTDVNILAFNFFATITGYNFVKYFGLAKFHHRSLANWLQIIQVFSAICFVALIYFTFQLEIKTLLYLGVFGIVTFLYAIPFLPKRFFLDPEKNLRSISGLKIYVIAIVWSGVTVLVPLLNNSVDLSFDVIITAVQVFLIVLVWMLPFEIRDLNYDSLKLSTIPQKIGISITKYLGTIIAIVFFALELIKKSNIRESIIVSAIIASVSIMMLLMATKNQDKYYSGFWVESLPILWLLLMLVI